MDLKKIRWKFKGKVKVKVVPVPFLTEHAMKAYWGVDL
jgi:hypothetical protein